MYKFLSVSTNKDIPVERRFWLHFPTKGLPNNKDKDKFAPKPNISIKDDVGKVRSANRFCSCITKENPQIYIAEVAKLVSHLSVNISDIKFWFKFIYEHIANQNR